VKDNTQKLEIKYTYIAAWAGNAELYSVIRCDNETYERQIVASFDELSKEENAELSQKCVDALNFTTDHDKLRAQLKAAEERNKELEKALIELRIVSVNYGNFTDKYRPRFLEVILETEQALTT